jgi:protein phosphatase-4 regulatory subunit 3
LPTFADTILSWNEPDTGLDYALSFAEPDGCTELWEQICSLQGRSVDERGCDEPVVSHRPSGATDSEVPSGNGEQLMLPAAEMRNLPAIAEMLADVPMVQRGRLAELLLAKDYVPQLVALFETAEDLDTAENLHRFFAIFKGIVMLNNTTLYETLLRDDLLMGVVGALEYDPELKCHEIQHRRFLREEVHFKEVIPFGDASVLKRVHQNFLIGFLKDVVLPRALDDNTFAALNQVQFYNNVQIVSSLTSDGPFLSNLHAKLSAVASGADVNELLDALRLLQELCTIAKTLQLYHRASFYRRVVEHGYFGPLATFLTRPEPSLRLAAIEVLLASTQHDPSLLRSHVLQQKPDSLMLRSMVQVLTSNEPSGEKAQITEVLRVLLDPDGMEGREQDEFLNLFYENYVHELAGPVAGVVLSCVGSTNDNPHAVPVVAAAPDAVVAPAPTLDGSSSSGTEAPHVVFDMLVYDSVTEGSPVGSSDCRSGGTGCGGSEEPDGVLSARQHVCELLCFCVLKHSYRIKYFILRNNILAKVLKLASHRDKCLVLAAVRFFRQCIGLKDEFYNRYIVKNRCFEPILVQLYANRQRDNLLHSSILELFEFVRKENIKSLIAHLVETYREKLTPLTHTEIFRGLVVRHDQNAMNGGSCLPPSSVVACGSNVALGARGSLACGPRRSTSVCLGGRPAFPDEDDDSAYFNTSDDDDEVTNTADGFSVIGVPGQWLPPPRPAHAPAVDRYSSGTLHSGTVPGNEFPRAQTATLSAALIDNETHPRIAYETAALSEPRALLGGLGRGGGIGILGGALPLVQQREQLSARVDHLGGAPRANDEVGIRGPLGLPTGHGTPPVGAPIHPPSEVKENAAPRVAWEGVPADATWQELAAATADGAPKLLRPMVASLAGFRSTASGELHHMFRQPHVATELRAPEGMADAFAAADAVAVADPVAAAPAVVAVAATLGTPSTSTVPASAPMIVAARARMPVMLAADETDEHTRKRQRANGAVEE